MSGLNDILGNENGMISQEKLTAYLEGRLSAKERHEVELLLAEEGMESDALEGLRDIPADEAKHVVNKLNFQLRNQLSGKQRRRKEPVDQSVSSWLAIILVLLLCLIGYIVFRYALQRQ
jgi:anti-sigma factor RsiW